MSEPIQPTPPGPPSPPAPPAPPVPRYGEYAPAGYVPPQPAPGFEAAAAAQQPYGYASYPGQFVQPVAGRRRKTWDLVLTVVLLVVGFFGMLLGLFYSAVLPQILDQAYQQQNLGTFAGDTGVAGPVIASSHVVLYLVAVGGAIPLLITKRVAFWVPLGAGVIAAGIFWVALIAVMFSDPSLISSRG
ncbi:MAG: hypothetical protein JWP32_1286 [Schumannella sp.]|nr:hypothetical protein [Schumannella sp.]